MERWNVPEVDFCPSNFWRWREELTAYWMTCVLQDQTRRHLRHTDRAEAEEAARYALGLLHPNHTVSFADEEGGSPLLEISSCVSGPLHTGQARQSWILRRHPLLQGARESVLTSSLALSHAPLPNGGAPPVAPPAKNFPPPPPLHPRASERRSCPAEGQLLRLLSAQPDVEGEFGAVCYDPLPHVRRHVQSFDSREEVVAVLAAFLLDFRSALAAYSNDL